MTAMPEDIDPENWLTREVFAKFGLAMYLSQVVERGIGILAVISGLRDGRYRAVEETDADRDELFRQTMGRVKTILLDRRPDIGHLADVLLRAVSLRNFLAHQYFWQRAVALTTEAGKNQMIEELDKAVAFFDDVDATLGDLAMEVMEATGMGKHMPEAMEHVEQAGFGDPLPGL
jgi:hypothetical protein